MKKITNIILFVAITLISMLFVPNVLAEENLIEIVSVKQGEMNLIRDDGKYNIDGVEQINLQYKINNKINRNKEYSILINGTGSSYTGKELLENGIFTQKLYLMPYQKVTDFTISLYEGSYNERVLIDEETISLNLTIHEELNFSNTNIEVVEISQNGNKLIPTTLDSDPSQMKLNINNRNDLLFKLKGNKLPEEYNYTLGLYYNENIICTGKELNDGVSIILSYEELKEYTYDFNNTLRFSVSFDIYNDYIYINNKGTGLSNYIFNVEESDDIKDFVINLSYKNYGDIEIKEKYSSTSELQNKYTINPNYHNENNELIATIKGDNYLEQDYSVIVSIYDNNSNKYYEEEITINGKDINKGYDLILEDFVMEYPELVEVGPEITYKIKITIDNNTNTVKCFYGYDAALSTKLFYPNGLMSVASFESHIGDYGSSYGYIINDNLFSVFDKLYLYYLGMGYEDGVIYDYELYITKPTLGETKTLVNKGEVTGKNLNTKGMFFDVRFNEVKIIYTLVIKKGNKIVRIDETNIELIDAPVLSYAKLNSRNKNVYFEFNNNNYLTTHTAPLNIELNGVGFNENVDYRVYMTVRNANDLVGNDEWFSYEEIFTGKELNDGDAYIQIVNENKYDDIVVRIMIDRTDGVFERYMIMGGMLVKYINSSDYFSKVTKYIIDKDIIRNINKKTNIEEFFDNIEIVDNGSIKVYDIDGNLNEDDYVGTGMTASVIDEEGRNIVDMDVVVKGDVTGDGEISITDLVKVERHVSEEETLEGVYEAAANVTDSGEVGPTDLVKISRDVAEIEEVE